MNVTVRRKTEVEKVNSNSHQTILNYMLFRLDLATTACAYSSEESRVHLMPQQVFSSYIIEHNCIELIQPYQKEIILTNALINLHQHFLSYV